MRWLVVLLLVGAGCEDASRFDADAASDANPTTDAASNDAVSVEALPPCDVLAAFEVATLDAPGRDSGDYEVPSLEIQGAVEDAARAIAAGQWDVALEHARRAEYVLCRGEGEERGLVLLTPAPPSRGWARAAVRLGDAGELILEAPHPIFETNTLAQAVALLEHLEARALVASGTHRCATATPVDCDGRTGVCGTDDDPFRVSDVAHAVDSTFHRIHVGLSEVLDTTVVVSVHGMSRAGVSLSDGTSLEVTASAPVSRLAAALVAEGVEEVTSCNPGAGVPRQLHLCGSTNVQGRHLNGSPQACTVSASAASGRFVHLEQSSAVRADPSTILDAFAQAFPR